MTTPAGEEAIHESRQTMIDLVELIAELNQHTKHLRREVAALSFMTLVQATDAVGSTSTLETLGGEQGVRRAVVRLYQRVMEDPELLPYFTGVDLIRVRQRQVDMFLALFGVRDYVGKGLKGVHEHLHVSRDHFNRLMDHLTTVLTEVGMPSNEVATFVNHLRPFEKEIVSA